MGINTKTILTGDENLDKHLEIGPDPHGAMCTGTGHSRADVKHDPANPAPKMTLTAEEQDILDGKKGKVLAKVMKTVVDYGNVFGADKLVDLGGNPHTVLMFGNAAVVPIIDIFNECADADLKAYAPYTIDPRPNDLYNLKLHLRCSTRSSQCFPYKMRWKKYTCVSVLKT